jgi:glutathione synthase/RimK-type ligase-like ATP-grasp enzyme
MPLHVAIATYVSTGAYDTNTVDEDALLSNLLEELGISYELLAWSDPDVDWSRFTHVLIKSTWDYFDYYPEFLAWLDKLEALGTSVLNPVGTLRWNSSKNYLLELKAKGYPCVAGQILPKGTAATLEALHDALEFETLVIKPLVSGGAKNTLKITRGSGKELEDKIASLLQEEDFLVQPYIPEIVAVGEYSLIFFNGVFSHAVLKSPAVDDFRVQHYYGGTIQDITPDSKMLASAQALVASVAKDSLYARVDGVVIDGVFHLMELELIEPYLFLGLSEKAIPNYKAALQKRLLGHV